MKRILLTIVALFTLAAAPARAFDISDYTAYPPFLPRTTSPNILFMIDYSAEMITPAYGTCTNLGTSDTLSDCRYTYSFLTSDYTSGNTYEGYFDVSTANQKYSYGAIDTVGGGSNNNGFTKSATGTWSANFLNWLSMTQFDIVKKVVVGGDVTPAPESARPNKMKSSQYEDRWMRKAINLPGDTAAGASWNACSSADTPDCVKFPALTYNWITTPASGTTTIWSDAGTTTPPPYIDDEVSATPKPITGFTHPFYFYGQGYSYVCISTNGVIGLTNSSTTCDTALSTWSNPDMPSATATEPNNIIAPYWDDLVVLGKSGGGGFTSSVKTFSISTPVPNGAPYNSQPYDIPYMSQSTSKVFVISYENVLHWDDVAGKADPMSFQILLYEGSNHIVFQYKDVRPARSFGGGKSATIGVENSDGTIAKKFSYCAACASNVVTNGSAVFASPVLTYGIRTTSSGTKAPSFYPAYPLGLACTGFTGGPCNPGTSLGPYDINIKINYTASPCGSGYYYNSDRNECYDHETNGLIQELRDSEASGGLGFRIAIMKVAGTEGGTVTKHFNDTGGWTNSLGALRDQGPSTGSPLSEALYDAQGYFREDTLYRFAVGDWSNLGAGTCAATGNYYDPYCFKSAAQLVSCCKSFVLAIGAGNYTYDFKTNIYSDILDASGSGPTPAQAGGYRTVPGETTGQEGTRTNGGWLDNIAYQSHTTDLRTNCTAPNTPAGCIDGNQNLTIYAVNTFGSVSTTLTAGILNSDTTIPVASTTGFPSTGRIQIDDEVISYTGKTSTSFTGCTRGVDGTTAAAHASGVEVYKSPGRAQTDLTVAALSTDTTINVTSTSGFTPTGKIQIDSEVISYTGMTAASFTGCGRGADSTTAASHLLGAIVFQRVPAVNGTKVLKRAAKYGGFEDSNGNNAYDSGEDDKDDNGAPDTYFEASEGSNIKSKIEEAIAAILRTSASGTSVSVLSTSAGGEGAIYQAYFYPAKLEGTAEERTWPGFMKSFFLDKKQNLRDDSSGGTYTCSGETCAYSGTPNATLSATQDKIAQMCLNTTTNEVKVRLFKDSDGNYVTDTANDGTCPSVGGTDPITVGMDDVVSIWEAGKKLALRDKSTRNIYTWVDTGGTTTSTSVGGFSSAGGTAKDFTTAEATNLKAYLRAADPDGAGGLTDVDEATNIINFIRGNAVTGYRNRCVTISGATAETGCSGSNQRVWALGDIINSTPTLVSGPGEQYDLLYKKSKYMDFRAKYQNRRRMVYVGGNDGMLHAFNAGIFNESTATFTANPSSGNGWGTAALGDELWAFVPYDNLPHLQWLACNGTDTDPSQCVNSQYTHVFYVDNRPKVTDVRIFCRDATADAAYSSLNYPTTPSTCISGQSGASHPNGWGTIMIMSMRFGGGAIDVDINGNSIISDNEKFRSAYYAFDITDPEKKPKLLWRFTDLNLDFTTSYPAIVRMGADTETDTGKWYMVVGNGPKNRFITGSNSGATPERDYGGKGIETPGKIFVVDLSAPALVTTFSGAASEYMGDPLVVDKDFDFESDVIYIGSSTNTSSTSTDNVDGKVYRINTNGNDTASTTNWNLSTLYNAGKPVLTSPSVAVDTDKNLWVFFGTGRLRNSGSPSDLTNYEQQTFYGIKDGCWQGLSTTSCTATATTGPTDQTTNKTYALTELFNAQPASVTAATTQVGSVTGFTLAESAACSTGTCSYSDLLSAIKLHRKGWYVNLSAPTAPATTPASERVLSRAAVLGGVVLFTTYKPAASICSIFGDSRLYALNYQTGTAFNKVIIGSSATGIGTSTSSTGTYISKGIELGKGMPTAVGIAVGEKVTGFVQKSTGEIVRIESEPGANIKSGAASWREKTGGGGTSEIETIYKHIVQ